MEGNTAVSFQACILTACVRVVWPGVSIAKTVTSAMQFTILPCCAIHTLPPKKQSAMQRDFENSQTAINFLSTRSNFLEMVLT